MENRYSELYFGSILNGAIDETTGLVANDYFTMLGSVNMYPTGIGFNYSAWATSEAFEQWKRPLMEFKKQYLKNGENFLAFRNSVSTLTHPVLIAIAQSVGLGETFTNHQILDAIVETCRAIAGAPSDADFIRCSISPEDFNLYIEFEKGGQGFTFQQKKEVYNQTIQENIGVVAQTVMLAHALATAIDTEYWSHAEWIIPTE